MSSRLVRIATVICVVLTTVITAGFVPARSDAAIDDGRLTDLINRARGERSLVAVTGNPQLTTAAQRYANYLATARFFSHTGLDGSTMETRLAAAGYTGWTFAAENLAAGQSSADDVMNAWLNSAGHRDNVLSPHVREIGIGYVYQSGSPYGHYWVLLLGAQPVATSPAPRPAAAVPTEANARYPANSNQSVMPSATWTAPETGKTVSGAWFAYLRAHGDVANLGLPLSGVMADPTNGGQTVQIFQRAIVELHTSSPGLSHLQRRLLGDILFPGADPPLPSDAAPPGPSRYFPFSPDRPTGLGHFVADFTRDGQPIYFKDYFDRNGGVSAFGYPKEEPKLRDGRWTQRFQAAVFEYHPEHDRDGTNKNGIPWRSFRVQLALLGDQYVKQHGFSLD
jgi:hypothetical protein